MRKKLFSVCLYVALAFAAISCNKTDFFVTSTEEIASVMTKSFNPLSHDPQTPIDFFSEMDFKEWTEIASIDDRFKACNVPRSYLTGMTTEAIAKSLIHYPLNYLILFYDDPREAVKLVLSKSNLHQEFIQRTDAARVITELFASLSIDMSTEKCDFDNDYEIVSYSNGLFIEYFISSGCIPGIFDGHYSMLLGQTAQAKLSQRESEHETFSSFSKYPLIEITEKIRERWEDSPSVTDSISLRSYAVSIQTFFKQSIHGFHFDEMTNAEIIYFTNTALSQYPNATLRGPASSKYNCHSYAWYDSSTTNETWINAEYNDVLQLSKFWTNDLYVSSTQSDAERAYYSSGDHSAVVLPSGKFLSKWGAGPLMEHDYNYCPYDYSNMQYYAERTTPLYFFTPINGNSPILVNQTNTYNFDPTFDFNYSVYVQYNEASSPTPFTFTEFGPGFYYLTCYTEGYYVLYLKGYRNGNCIADARKDIIVLNY
jgi:hypothetical protein